MVCIAQSEIKYCFRCISGLHVLGSDVKSHIKLFGKH